MKWPRPPHFGQTLTFCKKHPVLTLRRGLPARAGTGFAGVRLRTRLRPGALTIRARFHPRHTHLLLTAAGHLLKRYNKRHGLDLRRAPTDSVEESRRKNSRRPNRIRTRARRRFPGN
jgi:hypothetical protein